MADLLRFRLDQTITNLFLRGNRPDPFVLNTIRVVLAVAAILSPEAHKLVTNPDGETDNLACFSRLPRAWHIDLQSAQQYTCLIDSSAK